MQNKNETFRETSTNKKIRHLLNGRDYYSSYYSPQLRAIIINFNQDVKIHSSENLLDSFSM